MTSRPTWAHCEPSAAATATVAAEVFEGVAVSMGNPHLVCVTDTDVASPDLTTMPDVDVLAFPKE